MATPNQLELALRLKAAVEGLNQIQALAQEIEALGGDATAVRAKAAALADELSGLARQGTVIEVFKQVSAALAEAAAQLTDVQQKSAAAGAEQVKLQSNLSASRAALESAASATASLTANIDRASVEVKESGAALAGLTQQSKDAAAAVRQLEAAQASSSAEVRKADAALGAADAAVQKNALTISQLEARLLSARDAQRDLTNQVIASESPTEALTDRQEKATSRVELLSLQLSVARTRQQELTGTVQSATAALAESEQQQQAATAAAAESAASAARLRLEVEAAREALDRQRASLAQQAASLKESEKAERDLGRAVREDEAAIAKQAKTLADLEQKLRESEEAHRKQTVEVERGANALRFAGIDAKNLAAEEQRVTRETINAKNAASQLTLELTDQRNALRSNATEAGKAAAATRNLSNEQERAKDKADGFSGALGGMFKRVTSLAAAYIGLNEGRRVLQSILDTGDQFEVFEKQLAATFGTAEGGQAAFEWVRKFAKDTPQELDQVLEATIQLKNFGLDPLDGTLQSLVDQNSKLGGSQEKLQRIISATGQAFAKGRLQGEELLQFAEAGVPVFDLLSQSTGKTTAEVIKLAEEGRLGRDVLRDLIKAIGDNAVGASAAQMETLSGRVSNAKDNYQSFLNVVANNGPLQLAKGEISALGSSLEDSDSAARVVGQSIVAVVQAIFALGNVGVAVGKSFKLGFDVVGAAIADVLAVIAFGMSKITFGDISKGYAEAADALQLRSRELSEASERDAESIRKSYSDAYTRYGNAVGAAVEAVNAANGEISASSKEAAEAQTQAAVAAEAAAAARETAAQKEAEALQRVRADAKALGLDYSLVTTGISEDTVKRISAIQSLAENSSASGKVVKAAFEDALNAAKTQEEARAIGDAVKGIEKPGFDAAAALDQVGQKLRALPTEAERANVALTEAFKTLGLTSTAELERAAAAAETAYGKIKASGTATTTQLAEGYASVAEKRLALAAAEGESELRAEASRLRAGAATAAQREQLDEVIAKFPELADAGSKALDKVAGAGKKVVDVLAEIKNGISSAESIEQLDNLRSQLLQTYLAGKVSGDEYKATVEAIKEKTEELARASTGVAAAIANLVSGNRAMFKELSDDAAKAFDAMLERSTFVNQSVSNFFTAFTKGVLELQRVQASQSSAADDLTERLNVQRGTTVALVQEAVRAAQAFKFVDSQRLDALNEAIENARSRLRGLRDDAASTVSSLRDELDRLRGNEDAIDQRRRDAQRAELQAQIKEAEEFRDRETVAALQRGLQYLNEIDQVKAQQARAEGRTPTAPAATASNDANRSTRKVSVEFRVGGGSATGLFEETDADRLLSEFARAQSVSPTRN